MNRDALFNTKQCKVIFSDRLYIFESAFHLYMLLQNEISLACLLFSNHYNYHGRHARAGQ